MIYFTGQFGDFVCNGDSLTCEVDGITYTATLERDYDTGPRDHDGMAEAAIEAWERDEWHYFGVVISAEKAGVELIDNAASLWGIEGNFPGGDNGYFAVVANELMDEAIPVARAALEATKAALAS